MEAVSQEDIQKILSRLVAGRTRVRDKDGFCGTIEYIGPVASAKNEKEVYAGIAWDDPSRGKHNGSVICRKTQEIVQHFSSKGGSFMRISKLDLGTSLDISLIRSRYVEPSAPLVAPNNLLPHTARTSSGKEKSIEFHGEMKIRTYQQPQLLPRIAMRNMGISSISPQLVGFNNLRELDLGGNLICEWDIVFEIINIFPALDILNLASNRIGDFNGKAEFQSSLATEVNLHSCGIQSYTTVEVLDKIFPELKQLCLAYNNLSNLMEIQAKFQKLEYLDISSCEVTSWCDQVNKLSKIACLKTLLLNDNEIQDVSLEKEGFHTIEHINLTGTSIREWEDIQDLASLPRLRSLSLRSTPLTSSMGAAEARFNLIARYPLVNVVNSSPVPEKERSEAERRYVSQVTQELLLLNEDDETGKETLTARHPQFERLSKRFYADMQHQSAAKGFSAMSSYTVNVNISSMASGSCEMESLQKRLPSSLTIGRLKLLCSRAFGLDIDLQILHYRTAAGAFATELKDDSYTLGYYGVCDGGEILMNEIDLKALREDEKRKQNMHEREVSKQETETNSMQQLQKDLRQKGLL